MKGAMSLCVSVLALGIYLPASFGLLSNEKRFQRQNMFGGYGEIHIAAMTLRSMISRTAMMNKMPERSKAFSP